MPDTYAFDPSRICDLEDPVPALQELQDGSPVHWSPRYGAWLITRYDDVRAGLNDARLSPRRVFPNPKNVDAEFGRIFADYRKFMDLWVLVRDPPDHTRLRGLVNKALTPTAIEALRPEIARIVAGLVNTLPDSGVFDLVPHFAYPLPAEVIAALIGVPHSTLEDLKRWSDGIASSTTTGAGEELYRRAAYDVVEMATYLTGVIAQRRANPGTAIIDRMIAAHEGEDRLSQDELISNLILFLFAGHETTTNLLANGLRTLLRNPEQLEDLRANLDNKDVVRNTTDEILRYDGAVFVSLRTAVQDFEWHGQKIKTGHRIFLYHIAANRDRRAFKEPNRFDIRRADVGKHIAFGYGIHFCLGAPLARLEMEIALPALLRKYPRLSLDDPGVVWKDNLILRGMEGLRLRVG
jgi:cytochrome P450